jgi:hypothetical protein
MVKYGTSQARKEVLTTRPLHSVERLLHELSTDADWSGYVTPETERQRVKKKWIENNV